MEQSCLNPEPFNYEITIWSLQQSPVETYMVVSANCDCLNRSCSRQNTSLCPQHYVKYGSSQRRLYISWALVSLIQSSTIISPFFDQRLSKCQCPVCLRAELMRLCKGTNPAHVYEYSNVSAIDDIAWKLHALFRASVSEPSFPNYLVHDGNHGKGSMCKLLIGSARGGGWAAKKRVAAGVTRGIIPECMILFAIVFARVATTKVS